MTQEKTLMETTILTLILVGFGGAFIGWWTCVAFVVYYMKKKRERVVTEMLERAAMEAEHEA